jgi:cell division ATPase FtsA
MNLPSFKKVYEDNDRFLVLNINARDVKCLELFYNENLLNITGAGFQELPEGSVRNGMILYNDIVIEAIKNTVEKTTQNSQNKTRNVIVGLDGGITTSLTTTVRMRRPTSEPIQSSEVENIYQRIEEAAIIQARNKVLENTGDPDMDISAITTSDIYFKVDDQKVGVLEGQRGQTVEMAVYNAFVPNFHIKAVQNVIKKSGLNIMAIGSQMYSLVELIKTLPNNPEDFVLINLSEDSTDVGAVFSGGITSSRSLNVGYLHFLKAIGSKMGLSSKETEAVIKMYKTKRLSESETSLIKSCLEEVLEIWVDGLKILFEDFPGVKTFAPTVYFSGCGSDIEDVFQALETEQWSKTIPFKNTPEFKRFSFLDSSEIVNITDQNIGNDWTYMASASFIYKEIIGVV